MEFPEKEVIIKYFENLNPNIIPCKNGDCPLESAISNIYGGAVVIGTRSWSCYSKDVSCEPIPEYARKAVNSFDNEITLYWSELTTAEILNILKKV